MSTPKAEIDSLAVQLQLNTLQTKWLETTVTDLIRKTCIDELERLRHLSIGEKRSVVKKEWTSTDLADWINETVDKRIEELSSGAPKSAHNRGGN